VPVPDEQLPITLPYDVEFTGREGNPLPRRGRPSVQLQSLYAF